MTEQDEFWKDIGGYEGIYQVSNQGRVRSIRNSKIKLRALVPCSPNGITCYYKIMLYKEGRHYESKWVHRLVAEAFIPNDENLKEINHKDENGLNNLVNNLEWCSHKYNNNYGTKNKRTSLKLSKAIKQYDREGNYIRTFNSAKEACEFLGVSIDNRNNISKVCNGIRKSCLNFIWKYE